MHSQKGIFLPLTGLFINGRIPPLEPGVLAKLSSKKLSESPIITFVRGFTLLAILITLPGLAICWNHLPKDVRGESVPSSPAPDTETTSVFAPESIPLALTEVQAEEVPPQPISPVRDGAVRQVSWEPSRTESPLDFESLKLHLQALGVTSYSLKKWGNSGELFHFSCLVAPSESYTYEKHFQHIGSDAATVIQKVIADIERWKTSGHTETRF